MKKMKKVFGVSRIIKLMLFLFSSPNDNNIHKNQNNKRQMK